MGDLHPSWSHLVGLFPLLQHYNQKQKHLLKIRNSTSKILSQKKYVSTTSRSQKCGRKFGEIFHIPFIEHIVGIVDATTIPSNVIRRITQDIIDRTVKVRKQCVLVDVFEHPKVASLEREKSKIPFAIKIRGILSLLGKNCDFGWIVNVQHIFILNLWRVAAAALLIPYIILPSRCFTEDSLLGTTKNM